MVTQYFLGLKIHLKIIGGDCLTKNGRLKPRAAQKKTKADYKEAKSTYRQAKNAVKLAKKTVKIETQKNFGNQTGDQKSLDKSRATLEKAKKAKKQAKKAKKAARKTKKITKKTNPTTPQRVGRWAKTTIRQSAHYGMESAFGQDDTLGTIVEVRRTARQAKRTAKAGYQTGKYTAKGTYWGAKTTYKGTKKLAAYTAKIANYTAKSVAATVFSNPISWLVAGIGGFLLLIVILVSSVFPANIVQQTEFTLNQSWVQVSKRDADKSNNDVRYKTDIDSILLYMNYRYGGEWEPDATWDDGRGGKIAGFMHFNHFSDALNDIWNNMNKDPNQLKTMSELYGEKSKIKWIKLDKDEREEYKELLDAQKETGKYPSMQELENPLISKTDTVKKAKEKEDSDTHKESDTVTIDKRYGFYGKHFWPYSSLQVNQGTKLYAAMDGVVSVTKKDVTGKKTGTQNIIIKTDTAEFIYYNVSSIRVKDKVKVEAGDELGKVNSSNGQRVAYAKRYELAEKGKTVSVKNSMKDYVFTRYKAKQSWMLVNPGFYWAFVTYTQKTESASGGGSTTTLTAEQVAQKANISKERAQDVINIFNHMMSQEKATLQGSSGVLAIAERESGFDPAAINPGGGVAGYLQWSGWSSKINGDRWANAPSRTLDSRTELALLHTELSSSHSSVKTYLQTAKDAGEAALYFSEHYEGVALSDGQTKADKLKTDAKKWERIFKDSLKKSSGQGSGPGGTKASSFGLPSGYDNKLKWGQPSQNCITSYPGNRYPQGQCTFYVKNRIHETWNIDVANNLGNGQDWVRSLTASSAWRATSKPEVGAVMSTAGGFDTTLPEFGHVSFVEAVNDDGSFLVSELNYAGNQSQVHWRVINNANYYSFAMPPGH